MKSMNREEIGLYWLYEKFGEYAGLIPFADEACEVLRRLIDNKEMPSFTFSPATSARRLIEHWMDTGRLMMRYKGKAIGEQLSGMPTGDDLSDYVELNANLDGQTTVRRGELVRLMLAEEMTVPTFLAPAEFSMPLNAEDAEYRRAWALWSERDIWANMQHQNDPDKFEKIQTHLSRIDAELIRLCAQPSGPSAPSITVASGFVQKSVLQEKAILEWLANNDWNALELPKPPPGKGGVKHAAWAALLNQKRIFGSKGTFDKAWERLRASKLVADKE